MEPKTRYNLRKRPAAESEPVAVKSKPPPKKAKVETPEPKRAKAPQKKIKKEEKVVVEKVEEKQVDKEHSDKKQVDKKQAEASNRCQLIFGEDTCGELGLGKIGVTKKMPVKVPLNKPIQQVACGPMHTLSLTIDGEVYSYGCNDEGALGRVTDGDEELEANPTLVPLCNKVIKITAGDSHSTALTDQHEVFVWGNFRDEHGTIGLTPESKGESTLKPIQLVPQIKFKDIASGSNHILMLDVDGDVYSFGVGAQGQLGRLKPDDVGDTKSTTPIGDDNRELFLKPQKVNLKNVDPNRPYVCDAIYAGNFSSFATNTDKKKNRLAAWGLNNYFQLGFKGLKGQLVQHVPKRATFTCSTSMVGVACGPHHTLFLTKTGRVYSAGRAEYGMLGLGKVSKEICPAKCVDSLGNSIIQISAGINTSFAVSDEGKLFAWGMRGVNLGVQGDDDLIHPTEVESLQKNKVISLSTGGTFTSVIVE